MRANKKSFFCCEAKYLKLKLNKKMYANQAKNASICCLSSRKESEMASVLLHFASKLNFSCKTDASQTYVREGKKCVTFFDINQKNVPA